METFHTLMRDAALRLKNADHMVYVTYPLINDPKLIIVIIEHLYHALLNALNALIKYEYHQKRLYYMPQTLTETVRLLRDQLMDDYRFSLHIPAIFDELHRLIEFRKKSPIEFVRKANFVICDTNYSTHMINFQKIKKYDQEIKSFIYHVQEIIK